MNLTKLDIEQALTNQEFELHYQPKVSFLRGEISGAECLIRWNHPEHGFVSPELFIPLAEEADLITAITAQIVSMAIDAVVELKAEGFEGSLATVSYTHLTLPTKA